MKLSFSTKGWHGRSFDDFCQIAKDMKFEGIELHNIHNPLFTEKDGAFYITGQIHIPFQWLRQKPSCQRKPRSLLTVWQPQRAM